MGSKISDQEITKIKRYLKNKKPNLPGSIMFSRSFLSFSKERGEAELFLDISNNMSGLSKVLYILEKDEHLGYNLSTHGDIENVSFYDEVNLLGQIQSNLLPNIDIIKYDINDKVIIANEIKYRLIKPFGVLDLSEIEYKGKRYKGKRNKS